MAATDVIRLCEMEMMWKTGDSGVKHVDVHFKTSRSGIRACSIQETHMPNAAEISQFPAVMLMYRSTEYNRGILQYEKVWWNGQHDVLTP